MCRIGGFFISISFVFAGTANAQCISEYEARNVFPYYQEYDGALWVRVNSDIENLKLEKVNVRFIKANDIEEFFSIDIPKWVGMMERQPLKLANDIKMIELEAHYSDGCKDLVYRQPFQDELASLDLDVLTIRWVGKGFFRIFDCFTASPDKTIYIE